MTHHWVSLLDCGHYKETNASWNNVIETGRPSRPIEAYCAECNDFSTIQKFARVDNAPDKNQECQSTAHQFFECSCFVQ